MRDHTVSVDRSSAPSTLAFASTFNVAVPFIDRHLDEGRASLVLPLGRAFNRKIGAFAGIRSTPEGRIITEAEWERRQADWLPSAEDQAYVHSLMAPVTEPGKMANWIAAPAKGIDGKPIDFEYLRFN